MLECVINISEGRDLDLVHAVARAAGAALLDVHSDPDHHRSVLTVHGQAAARAVATAGVEHLDLRRHTGAHPRIGVVDVVPFVPLGEATMDEAVAARDRFGAWLADELGVPSFRYGPRADGRTAVTLPEIRRRAFVDLAPDDGPSVPHPTAGACAVGARPVLVAYNVWLRGASVDTARAIAHELRGPALRTLGLQVGDAVQVSMNLIDPLVLGPDRAYDAVVDRAGAHGVAVGGAELVGLVPRSTLEAIAPERWAELDLAADRTIEHRLTGGAAREEAP